MLYHGLFLSNKTVNSLIDFNLPKSLILETILVLNAYEGVDYECSQSKGIYPYCELSRD